MNHTRCLLSFVNKTKTPGQRFHGAKQLTGNFQPVCSFFYPDYTVGPGFSPDHVHGWTRGLLSRVTTDRELDPAIRTLPRRYFYNTIFFQNHKQ